MLTCLVAAAIACSPPADNNGGSDADNTDAAVGTPLVSPQSWTVIPASEDPVTDAPDATICDPDAGTGVEEFSGETAFAVKMADCEYVAVRQTTLSPISQGDTVFVRAWHFELTAPTDAEAHLAIALDGDTIWDERIPIPSGEGGLLTSEWTATKDIPVGSEIVFHGHNHGNNEYYLLEVSKR